MDMVLAGIVWDSCGWVVDTTRKIGFCLAKVSALDFVTSTEYS